MFYAASLPNIAIFLAAFAKAREQGGMSEATFDSAHRMIRFSDSKAATETLAWVGNEFLLKTIRPLFSSHPNQRNAD